MSGKQLQKYYTSRVYGKPSKKVLFLFSALGHKKWFYLPTIYMYILNGYQVIAYDASHRIIFDKDIQKFLDVGFAIVADVEKHVIRLKKEGVHTFSTHGNSMGTLYAMRSAIDIPEIQKVIVNLTYGKLSDNIWSWFILKDIKKHIIKQGLTKEEVEKIFKPLSPVQIAPLLKSKQILLFLARHDKVTLFEQGLQFKKALEKANVNLTYKENRLFGHNINLVLNNFKYKILLGFLR